MKKIYLFFLLALPLMLFSACGDDDESESDGGSTNDSVVVKDDGSTSNGSIFTAIDDKNFYLDYIKYTVEEGHLVVSGYDKTGFKGNAKIESYITYKNYTYRVLEIKESAFNGSHDLISITIPNSVTTIKGGAFGNCNSLTSIMVEKGNTFYDSRNNCNAIIEKSSNTLIVGCINTTIPNSVTSIGTAAFSGCTGLNSITIPNSVMSIGTAAFQGCISLTSITIPYGVAVVEKAAFLGCSRLKSITIPSSVMSINERAFAYCTDLTSITIPSSVTSIGDYSFEDCGGLTSIKLPNGVTTIGEGAFKGCICLKSISIPISVKIIEKCTFGSCVKLTDIHCYAEIVPSTDSDAFHFTPISNVTLYVPAASIEAYKAEKPWSDFKYIVAMK